MEASGVSVYKVANTQEYYRFIIKYYALLLNRKVPTGKEMEFLLGVIWANVNEIQINTKNRFFSEYFINRGWQHPNIHNYRDRLMVDKWLKVVPNTETFNFYPGIVIPGLPKEKLPIHFMIEIEDKRMYTQFPEENHGR